MRPQVLKLNCSPPSLKYSITFVVSSAVLLAVLLSLGLTGGFSNKSSAPSLNSNSTNLGNNKAQVTLTNGGAVATDYQNNVYYSDLSAGIVYKQNPSLSTTTLNYPMNNGPNAIAVDSSLNVYVCDTVTSSIYKIDPAGVRTTLNAPVGGWQGLQGVAIDSNANLYVLDNSLSTVYQVPNSGTGPVNVFATNGPTGWGSSAAITYPTIPGSSSLPSGATTLPVGATILPSGATTLPVGATTLPSGATTLPVGATTLPAGATSSSPTAVATSSARKGNNNGKKDGGIAVDKDDNIYITNAPDHSVSKVMKGSFTKTTYPNGAPSKVTVDKNGNTYVIDSSTLSVYQTSPTTGTLTTVSPSGGWVDPHGVAISPSGNLYVLDNGLGGVYQVTQNGFGVVSAFSSNLIGSIIAVSSAIPTQTNSVSYITNSVSLITQSNTQTITNLQCVAGNTWSQGSQCVACSVSQPGYYTVSACTTSSDTQIAPCAAGTFADKAGQSSCLSCPVDTYADTTAAIFCPSCPLNSVSTPGTSTCTCDAGLSQSGSGDTLLCSCPSGSFQVLSGSGDTCNSLQATHPSLTCQQIGAAGFPPVDCSTSALDAVVINTNHLFCLPPLVITPSMFDLAFTTNGFPSPTLTQYSNFVSQYQSTGGITSLMEAAMFLAHIMQESGGLQYVREWQCAPPCNDHANCCPLDTLLSDGSCPHGNQFSGDQNTVPDETCNCQVFYLNNYYNPSTDVTPPPYYYGRGYIQLTGLANYAAASQALYGDNRLVTQPDLVASNNEYSWATSFFYWKNNVHVVPEVLSGKFGYSTNAVNGPHECSFGCTTQCQNRFKFYEQNLKAFGLTNVVASNEGCGTADTYNCFLGEEHQVVAGETCSSLDSIYHLAQGAIENDNQAACALSSIQAPTVLCINCPSTYTPHTVVIGDTCNNLDISNNLAIGSVANTNPSCSGFIHPGQTLCIPPASVCSTTSQTYTTTATDTCSQLDPLKGFIRGAIENLNLACGLLPQKDVVLCLPPNPVICPSESYSYYVVSLDTCIKLDTSNNLADGSIANFLAQNTIPNIHPASCPQGDPTGNLQIAQILCIPNLSVCSATSQTFTTTATDTCSELDSSLGFSQASSGINTNAIENTNHACGLLPQSGEVLCLPINPVICPTNYKFHTVVSGDTCSGLGALNIPYPYGNSCSDPSLDIGQIVCVPNNRRRILRKQ